MKRFLLLLLACAMLVTMLAACSDGKTPSDTTGEFTTSDPANSETEVVTDEWGRPLEVTDLDVSELDFNNVDFNIICSGNSETDYWAVDPGLYTEPSDALELSLYRRNQAIQDDLNLNLTIEYKNANGLDSALNQAVANDAQANTGHYDLVLNYSAFAVAENLRGYYIDLMADSTPYINLEASWYNQNFIENTNGFGHLYYIVGDYNLSAYNRMMVTYVNLTQCTAYGVIDDVSGDDLYEMVLDGDWTYEVLLEYAKIFDDKGETEKNQNCVYGLLSNGNCEAYDGFLYAFDLNLVKVNEADGTHVWNIEGNEKFDSAMSKMQTLYDQDGVWIVAKSTGSVGTSVEQYEMFATGHALFDIDVIYRYSAQNKAFRNMSDKYGLLPLPKYDSDQTEYGSGLQDSHGWTSLVSGTAEQNAKRCAYLEYAYYLSYKDSRPYYFERIMKTQYLGTQKASQVFDIILDHAAFDFGEQYSWIMENAKVKLWRTIGKNGGTVSGAWTTYADQLNAALSELDAWFLAR